MHVLITKQCIGFKDQDPFLKKKSLDLDPICVCTLQGRESDYTQ